jgi:hypothetical protein
MKPLPKSGQLVDPRQADRVAIWWLRHWIRRVASGSSIREIETKAYVIHTCSLNQVVDVPLQILHCGLVATAHKRRKRVDANHPARRRTSLDLLISDISRMIVHR